MGEEKKMQPKKEQSIKTFMASHSHAGVDVWQQQWQEHKFNMKAKKFTSMEIGDYVTGWLMVTDDGQSEMENIKAAIHNALLMVEDDQDGLVAYLERRVLRTLPA